MAPAFISSIFRADSRAAPKRQPLPRKTARRKGPRATAAIRWHLRRQGFLLAIAHGFEEIGEVAAALGHGGPGLAVLAEEGGVLAIAGDGQVAFGAVEDVADG